MTDTKRLVSLDVLRGLAALLVVVQHAVEHYGNATFDYVQQNVINMGQIGVLIFFMISGYVIPYSQANAGRSLIAFWIARIFRIYPLYIVVVALNLALAAFLFHNLAPDLGKSLIAHVIFAQEWIGWPNYGGPSWTLFLELIWYTLFAALVFLRMEKNAAAVHIGLMALLLTFLILVAILQRQIPFGKVAFLVTFFLGYITYLYRNEALSLFRFRAFAISSVALTMLIMFLCYYLFRDPARPNISFLCIVLNWTASLIIFMGLIFSKRTVYSRFFIFLGGISFSVYLLHDTVINTFRHFAVDPVIYVPLILPVTIALSALTFRLIEKPGTRLGKRLIARLQTTQPVVPRPKVEG
ncbi:acyltransferase [Asticcacaulis sp. AND118]|uniref:acyltransferase family protein n=1 Tax=Asticcacaulis sp. AND118 TaxID=2840468 RepID=UPI001CFF6D5A|nr:acyltransferase [Asticcacaulis sp. AND118]UDF05049.1 acyltransferase [Asticcacaulis sp. AND118]